MCPECADHFGRHWDGLSLGEHLDSFDFPVLITSGERRILAVN